MRVSNKQIGWSQEANLLWEISRELDRINSTLCTGPCPTTTSTTTVAPFSDTINWGEDSGACTGGIPIIVTGDGPTFCDSNNFTGPDIAGMGTGTVVFSFGGQFKTVNVISGNNTATFNGGCDSCPT